MKSKKEGRLRGQYMKNEEKKAVGSLLAQKILKTEVISSEEESAFSMKAEFVFTNK